MTAASQNRPIVCDLNAMDAEQRQTHHEIGQRLLAKVAEWQTPADALALRFPTDADTLVDIARFMRLEQICCPFYTFELRVESEGDAWLRFTGDPEAVRYVQKNNPVAAP
jgi:hypothetical protein